MGLRALLLGTTFTTIAHEADEASLMLRHQASWLLQPLLDGACGELISQAATMVTSEEEPAGSVMDLFGNPNPWRGKNQQPGAMVNHNCHDATHPTLALNF